MAKLGLRAKSLLALVLACLLAAAPGMAKEAEATTGGASWYGPGLYGNSTASGEVLTPSTWGAAHNTLPFGTELTICYQGACANNVPVIDRGPYVGGRGAAQSFKVVAALERGHNPPAGPGAAARSSSSASRPTVRSGSRRR